MARHNENPPYKPHNEQARWRQAGERFLPRNQLAGGGTPTNIIMTFRHHHAHPPESWQNCLLSSLAVDAEPPPNTHSALPPAPPFCHDMDQTQFSTP